MIRGNLFVKMIIFLSLSFLILACTKELSKTDAEQLAIKFASSGIKYYVAGTNQTENVENPTVDVLASAHVKNQWRVLLKVSTQIGEGQKKQGLKVVMDDSSGKLLSLTQVNLDDLSQ